MKKDELQCMWEQVHTQAALETPLYSENEIEKLISCKYGSMVWQALLDQKKKVRLYVVYLAVIIGLVVYGLVYLGISPSIQFLLPIATAGFFILAKIVTEYRWLQLLKNTDDNLSIKESVCLFFNRLKRMGTIDFRSSIVYCWGWACWLTWVLWSDPGIPLLLVIFNVLLIVGLLCTPWSVKYHNKRHYERLHANLNRSMDFLTQ